MSKNEVINGSMASAAIDYVISNEKEYVNNPNDPGGETKYGISKLSFPSLDILTLSKKEARDIYLENFWNKTEFFTKNSVLYYDVDRSSEIESVSFSEVMSKLFDVFINVGEKQFYKILQRSLRSMVYNPTNIMKDDGIWGPISQNTFEEATGLSDGMSYPLQTLMGAVCSEAAGYYRLLAATKPHLGTFLEGWLNRAYRKPNFN